MLDFRAAELERRAERRDAWRHRYMHLTDALHAELGCRAFACWHAGGRGRSWKQNFSQDPGEVA